MTFANIPTVASQINWGPLDTLKLGTL